MLELPRHEKLLEDIRAMDLGDTFGAHVLELDRALRQPERRGTITGWRTRLLLYERERRLAWFTTVLDRTEPFKHGRRLELFTPGALNNVLGPGEDIPFKTFLKRIKNINLAFDHGSWRSILTPGHIEYLLSEFKNTLQPDINAVIYSPRRNIFMEKGRVLIFPKSLRVALLRHIPSVNIITQAPVYTRQENVDKYWLNIRRLIRKQAANVRELNELGDSRSLQKDLAAGFRTISVLTGHPSIIRNQPAYLQWRTSDWDDRSSGHSRFIEMAQEYLVTPH